MSTQTLISSLTWIPRGRAAPTPVKYNLDETELQRVGKMGGEGALEKLREEMEGLEMEVDEKDVAEDGEGGDDWEDESNEASGSGSSSEDEDEEKEAKMELDEGKPSDPNDLSAYNLDTYDEEESRGAAMGAFSNIKGLSFYRDNKEDPYITLKDDEEDDDPSSLLIHPTDSLLLTAKTSDDLSSLEYHIYSEADENLWVHHDLLLPSFPLCVEWLDFPASRSGAPKEAGGAEKTHGNYVAVGTMDTAVEIWDLDILDSLYPTAILGPAPSLLAPVAPAPAASSSGGKKKKKLAAPPPPEANESHHTQSIISLSWTPAHRNLLLTSSADETIKLWDLSQPSPCSAIRSWSNIHPGEKVLSVEWNRFGLPGAGGPAGVQGTGNSTVVLSAGERTVRVWDSRSVEGGVGTGVLGSDVECVRWDCWNEMDFFVSLENGLILCYDARTLSSSPTSSLTSSKSAKSPAPQPKYTISAHNGACSALDVNPHIRGCLASGGMDKVVKIWNVNEEEGKREVSLVTSRDLGVGKVFTIRFSPDSPLTLAAGGSLAKLQLWDVATNAGARQAFGPRLKQAGKDMAEYLKSRKGNGVIGLDDDDEEDSEEE